MCGRRGDAPGDSRVRAAMRCSLPDFDPERWDPAANREAAAEAEQCASDLKGSAANQGVELDYDLDEDGCAWGWALSGYASSVYAYSGRRTPDDERRQPSYRMLRLLQLPATPERDAVIEAVELLENHEDGAWAIYHALQKPP